MSLPNELLPVGLLGTGAVAAEGYAIERSVRFNSSDSGYLSRTPASAGNRKTWTWAGWVKRSAFSRGVLFASTLNATNLFALEVRTDALDIYDYETTYQWRLNTTAVFRDPSAWMHICFALDTTQATSANRAKLYINGVQVSTFNVASYPSLDYQGFVNTTNVHDICSYSNGAGIFFSGYLADIHFIDGQALDPTSFGEFDDNGIWQPKAYTGSYGTNGFHLDFSDNSTAAALGTDTSPNGNTWTVNNISVAAGAGNDSLVDVPTNGTETDTGLGGEVRGNYCTLNPLDQSISAVGTISNGNLDYSQSSTGTRTARCTFGVSSGKWYWEFTHLGGTGIHGIARSTSSLTTYPGGDTLGYCWASIGDIYNNASGTGAYSGLTYTTNDVIGVALDLDTGTLVFYKNGVSQGTAVFGLTGMWFPAFGSSGVNINSFVTNFGQRPFAYTAPSGFKALCTANLPAPGVTKSSTVFDTTLWTGNGFTRSITGLGFSPDLVWIKHRASASGWHCLFDTVRGDSKVIHSNAANTELANDPNGYLSAFNSDGFTVTRGSSTAIPVNEFNQPYVGWCWDAGSSTVTNTDGSITSTVRANPSAGFSIVTYTGTGSSATVGHGLGASPKVVLIKQRSGTQDWYCYTTVIDGSYDFLYLNRTDAKQNSAFSVPSSSVFNLSTGIGQNGSGSTYVAYCFAPVSGYSSFGSYTGNGSADGPFVFTNHRPRWILLKRTDTTSNWTIIDTAREGYNVDNDPLYPNLSNAESTTDLADILSNGFKLRSADASVNANAGTYIYASFAESPFQYSRAR